MDNFYLKYFKDKKVLITGHTGFKGAWMCIILKHLQAKVYGISLEVKKDSLFEKAELKKNIHKHYIFDIKNKKKLKKIILSINPDIVIHFAAQSLVLEGYNFPFKTFETNFIGTLNLLDLCSELKNLKKILITTTDKVYDIRKNKKFKENDKLWGYDPYSASKVAVEQLVDSYRFLYRHKKLKKIILVARSGNVIGGGDISKNRIIPDIIKSINNNSMLYLRNPNSIRPWQHVLDPLFGYLKLIYLKKNTIENNWNFSSSDRNFKKVIDIVKIFKTKFNFNFRIIKNSKKETQILKLSNKKSIKHLSWEPKLNFNQAIDLVVFYEKEIKKKRNPYFICLDQIKDYLIIKNKNL